MLPEDSFLKFLHSSSRLLQSIAKPFHAGPYQHLNPDPLTMVSFLLSFSSSRMSNSFAWTSRTNMSLPATTSSNRRSTCKSPTINQNKLHQKHKRSIHKGKFTSIRFSCNASHGTARKETQETKGPSRKRNWNGLRMLGP